jgi:predicted 3-demethylubiquinone-9 3-methyltransferase (glyoxalase superfamily)
MQKISPLLWFDDKAEEAANLYTSLFKNSKILSVTRYSGYFQDLDGHLWEIARNPEWEVKE